MVLHGFGVDFRGFTWILERIFMILEIIFVFFARTCDWDHVQLPGVSLRPCFAFYITYSYDGNNLSDADIIVLCIDRTIVPASIVKKLMNVKAKILNFSILDISKRQFSSLILKQNDPWPGKAIVKTNRNAHGGPELMQQVNNNGEAKAQKHDLQTIDAAMELPTW